MSRLKIQRTNMILYCREWLATVKFYRDLLQLPITYESDWFVEFQLADLSCLSVADERRASVKSSGGAGITVTLQVPEIESAWQLLADAGVDPGPIRPHAWGDQVFYFFDPEGHRLEIWSSEPIVYHK